MVLGSTSQGGSYSAVAKRDERTRKMNVVERSPFLRPSDPRALRRISTPGGTVHLKKVEDEAEHKSTIIGASANLIVSIVGAGIMGIPYAIRESGLLAGIFMTVFVAVITEKSLRLLIETAKHVDIPSYEVLYEASFGPAGFVAMSLIMFSMSYGAMVSYMMIMKDTISDLLGVYEEDYFTRRCVLLATTALVLFPLSVQRDMADLAKTSKVSVIFYVLIVSFVIFNSPIPKSIKENGGWTEILSHDIIRPETFFTGLGVLSFAYVCQHSAFIIAGSLKRPTKQRWSRVSANGLLFSGTLATLCGVFGYLGFLDDTDGNVLNNFENLGDPLLIKLCNASRAMLVVCMFFVYPMDAFVSRHVCVVLLFKGRRAHEGDDHAVLARLDRRVALTCGMIGVTLLPALLLKDLGVVLAITGSIAGSTLSYIGPGSAYLAIHGEEFIRIIKQRWTWGSHLDGEDTTEADVETRTQASGAYSPPPPPPPPPSQPEPHPMKDSIGTFFWFVLLMPLWVRIAQVGQQSLEKHYETEALKSPHPSRLGKIVHHNLPKARVKVAKMKPSKVLFPPKSGEGPTLPRTNSESRALETRAGTTLSATNKSLTTGYGSISATTGSQVDALMPQQPKEEEDESVEEDPQDSFPQLSDFLIAIFFVVFGVIAMVVGLLSIYLEKE